MRMFSKHAEAGRQAVCRACGVVERILGLTAHVLSTTRGCKWLTLAILLASLIYLTLGVIPWLIETTILVTS